jgi:phage tail protein X
MATERGVTVIAQQSDMIDLMVWRHYGRQDGRRVE